MRPRSAPLPAALLLAALALAALGAAACGGREGPGGEAPGSVVEGNVEGNSAQGSATEGNSDEGNSARGSEGEGATAQGSATEENSPEENSAAPPAAPPTMSEPLEGEARAAAIAALPEPFRPLFAADLDSRYRWAYNADYESGGPLRDRGELRCRHVAVRRLGERLAAEWACAGRADTDDENETLHLVWLADSSGLWLEPRSGGLSVTLTDAAHHPPDRPSDLPFPLAASRRVEGQEGEEGAQRTVEVREERLRGLAGTPAAWCLHDREEGEPSQELQLCLHPARGLLLWHTHGYPVEERWRAR